MYISDEAVIKMERTRAKLESLLKEKEVSVTDGEDMNSLVRKVDNIGKNDILYGIINQTIETFSDENITQISQYLFSNCGGLLDVNIPNVTLIGDSAFLDTALLNQVNMDNVESLKSAAFRNSGLPVAYLPNIQSIGSQCFYKIKKLYIGKKINIAAYAIASDRLTLLVLDTKEVCTLASTSFNTNSNCKICVPKTLADGTDGVETYSNMTNWTTHASKFDTIENNIDLIKETFPKWEYKG